MKRGVIESQSLFYVLGMVVFVITLGFGYLLVTDTADNAESVQLEQLRQHLANDASLYKSPLGAETTKTYAVQGFSRYCIFDLNHRQDMEFPPNLPKLISDSVQSGADNNMFFYADNIIDSIAVPHIQIDEYPYYVCGIITGGVLALHWQGQGDGVSFAGQEMVEAIPGAVAVSKDSSSVLILPNAVDPSLDEVAIEVVDPSTVPDTDQAVYRFSPSGATFDEPARVQISYDPAIYGDCPSSIQFNHYHDNGALKEVLDAVQINCPHHYAVFELDSFSFGTLVLPQDVCPTLTCAEPDPGCELVPTVDSSGCPTCGEEMCEDTSSGGVRPFDASCASQFCPFGCENGQCLPKPDVVEDACARMDCVGECRNGQCVDGSEVRDEQCERDEQCGAPIQCSDGTTHPAAECIDGACAVINYLRDPCPDTEIEPTACSKDAKVCPDGTTVGRVGPNCEFEDCPESTDDRCALLDCAFGCANGQCITENPGIVLSECPAILCAQPPDGCEPDSTVLDDNGCGTCAYKCDGFYPYHWVADNLSQGHISSIEYLSNTEVKLTLRTGDVVITKQPSAGSVASLISICGQSCAGITVTRCTDDTQCQEPIQCDDGTTHPAATCTANVCAPINYFVDPCRS